jgi:hypothetical protein
VPGGLTDAQAYGLGDLDGDGDNDFDDFRLFQADYIAANGAAAFAALVKAPEPAGVLLAGMALACAAFTRRRSRHQVCDILLRSGPRSAQKKSATAVGAVLMLGFVAVSARADVTHEYTFNDLVVEDLVGSADGTLENGATINFLGQVELSGVGQYVNLPGGTIAISGYVDATFEAWYRWDDSGGGWDRVFDFGNQTGGNGTNYIFYTPNGSGGFTRAALHNGSGEDQAGSTPAVSSFTLHHVAVVVDDGVNGGVDDLILYVDGVERGRDTNMTRNLAGVGTNNAWLGRSLYVNDQYFTGRIDEFRIHDTALSAEDVLARYQAGPVAPDLIELEVNTFTGEVTLRNTNAMQLPIDYYQVTSAGSALSPTTWSSLDDQNADAIGGAAGESWDEGGVPTTGEVSELFLLGASAIAADGTRSLGQLFDPNVFGKRQDGDLEFFFGIQGSDDLVPGVVTYFAPAPLLGDYNDDGTVNAADYTVYRNCKSGLGGCVSLPAGTDDTPGSVDVDDFARWKLHYGDTIFGAGAGATVSAENVPEPASLTMIAMCLGLLAANRRPRRAA